jgi:hypothetical protein
MEIRDDGCRCCGIERDALFGRRLGDADGDVERVTAERCHLDCHDIVDGGEAPRRRAERDAAHGGLQVADQRISLATAVQC